MFLNKGHIYNMAFSLWKKGDWAGLEKFMGKGSWPPNRGFASSSQNILPVGTKLDRYGGWHDSEGFHDRGTFLSPAGSSFEGRALPDSTRSSPFNTYEVIRPISVESGPAIPWFGKPGMGIQHEASSSMDNLVNNGYLRRF